MAPTGQVPGPVPPELLVPETIDDGTHEARDDVDDEDEDVADLQAQAGEERDESRLEGGNHEGEKAEQQLERQDGRDSTGMKKKHHRENQTERESSCSVAKPLFFIQ